MINIMLHNLCYFKTNDSHIRSALKKVLNENHKHDPTTRIIEELGLKHGSTRVDIAVVNGVLHGYELKSDLDTLIRLPEQMKIYNSILDKITLVVGKNHLYEAVKLIPDWWGIVVAKTINNADTIKFCEIRKSENNPYTDSLSIASLLWRDEALQILEKYNGAKDIKYKSKDIIYYSLITLLDQKTLKENVRRCLTSRINWRSEKSCIQDGD